MNPTRSREIRLASHSYGWPTLQHFKLAGTELPPLGEGQVLVKNLYMSVDPYMRGRMSGLKSEVPPFRVGEPLEGTAVGEVIASRTIVLNPGDAVLSMYGWREYFVASAGDVRWIDRRIQPLSAYLGALGTAGLTAWAGLNLVGVHANDLVFISGADGAVGCVAGQLAKLRGCHVLGSAGSREKVSMLVRELGFDAAFNYRDGGLAVQLRALAPNGIDVYFDNVGGAHLEAALTAMRPRGRIVACGAQAQCDEAAPFSEVRNLSLVITKRLTMKGFIVSDWLSLAPAFIAAAGDFIREGKLLAKETLSEGIEHAPQAFIDLLRGENVGKTVVKLA